MTDGERPEWRSSGGTLSCSPSAQRHCGTLNHFCFMLLEQWVCRLFPGSSSAPSTSKDHLQPLWMGLKVLRHHIRAQTAAFRIPLSPGAVGEGGVLTGSQLPEHSWGEPNNWNGHYYFTNPSSQSGRQEARVNKSKQWCRSPIAKMKVWLELMNKSLNLSQTKLHFKELKSCELQAWEKLTSRSRTVGVLVKFLQMLVVKKPASVCSRRSPVDEPGRGAEHKQQIPSRRTQIFFLLSNKTYTWIKLTFLMRFRRLAACTHATVLQVINSLTVFRGEWGWDVCMLFLHCHKSGSDLSDWPGVWGIFHTLKHLFSFTATSQHEQYEKNTSFSSKQRMLAQKFLSISQY